MKIGIDISQSVYEGTGSARYTHAAIDSILENKNHEEWVFFFSGFRKSISDKLTKQILTSDIRLVRTYLPPHLLNIVWNKFQILPLEFLTKSLDWFITSDWTQPKTRIKTATLIHDLTFLRNPDVVPEGIRSVQTLRLKRALEKANVLLALSQATKQDLLELVPDVKNIPIEVLYPHVPIQDPSKTEIQHTLEKFQINKPFILSVGKVEPRKNINRLVRAFEKVEADISLVIVGPPGWDTIQTHNPRIIFTGYVTDSELFSLYKSALCLCMPSLWEGFGYPIVEAMGSHLSVVTSNNSSLAEIGNGCALFVDPYDEDQIAQTLKRVVTDENLRSELSKKGAERAKQFSGKIFYDNLVTILTKYS